MEGAAHGDPESEEPRRRPEHWAVLAGALLAVVALFAFASFLEPDERGHGTHEQLGFKPCLPMLLWNFPCPGCGVTTSVVHAARGELGDSLRVQPFGLVIALATILFALWAVLGHLRGRDLWRSLASLDWALWARVTGIALALSWVYKVVAVRGWP